MTIVNFADLSARADFEGFYVPRFEVTLARESRPGAPTGGGDDILRDVQSIIYQDNIEEIDGFELTVSNWNDEDDTFKYIGSETQEDMDATTEAAERFKLFEPCHKKVVISLGYGNALRQIIAGNVTTMAPHFPAGGASTLTVTGLNRLHQLRKTQHSHAWTEKTPAQIVEDIANMRDDGEPRIPVPIEVIAGTGPANEPISYIAQDNQYDIDFILYLGRRFGYELSVEQDEEGSEERLRFAPARHPLNRETVELKWGQSIVDFQPTITTANQLKKLTIRGWDRRRKEPIEYTIDVESPEFADLNPDLRRLIGQCDAREEKVVNRPVFTEAQARAEARELLERRQHAFVEATCKVIGHPLIRAGAKVHITGVGSRLSGVYFVRSSKHTLGQSEYLTEFTAHREGPLPNAQ